MSGCVVFGQSSFIQSHQNSKAPCAMLYYSDIPTKSTSDHVLLDALLQTALLVEVRGLQSTYSLILARRSFVRRI